MKRGGQPVVLTLIINKINYRSRFFVPIFRYVGFSSLFVRVLLLLLLRYENLLRIAHIEVKTTNLLLQVKIWLITTNANTCFQKKNQVISWPLPSFQFPLYMYWIFFFNLKYSLLLVPNLTNLHSCWPNQSYICTIFMGDFIFTPNNVWFYFYPSFNIE